MLTQMGFLFATDRLAAHEAAFAAGNVEEPALLSSRQVLEFATIEGAHVCGIEDRTGSITVGKQADLVLIRGDQSNTYPVIDPVSTVVHQADTRNVDTVMVARLPPLHHADSAELGPEPRPGGNVQLSCTWTASAIRPLGRPGVYLDLTYGVG